MINGQQEQNIMCEIRNKYGKFNWINNKAKGDAGAAAGNANTQHFIIVGGDGVWKDFIGVKCLGAYFGMPENHFTWKGKCNVPDSLLRNTKEKIGCSSLFFLGCSMGCRGAVPINFTFC